MTMSAPLVASATDFAPVPPRSVQVLSAAGLRSNTVTWWFERLMMLRHIGPPMLPTPMNPTFMASSPGENTDRLTIYEGWTRLRLF